MKADRPSWGGQGFIMPVHNIKSLKLTRKALRGSLTPAEAILWKNLQRSQLEGMKFRRQHSIGKYVVDFYCPKCKLAIELDGEGHFNSFKSETSTDRNPPMQETRKFIETLGFPATDGYELLSSPKRFPDGAQYRFEIPTVEGPRCLKAVIEEAQKHHLIIHRVSQGSGIMLLTDDEIKEMLKMAKDQQMEVSLFVGPRAAYDIGALPLTPAGKIIGWSLRGADQIVYAVEDIKRGCDLGLRGVLIADLGLLWLVNEMKKAGKLPSNLVAKVSVQLSANNPISVKILENCGADTFNISSDLPLPLLASARKAVSIPLDLYVETPDNFGGFIRHFEVPEMIRVVSPLYVKLGLRNAPDVYPCGTHLEATAIALSRERVRRAKIASDMIQRYYPEAVMSKPGGQGLGIPEI